MGLNIIVVKMYQEMVIILIKLFYKMYLKKVIVWEYMLSIAGLGYKQFHNAAGLSRVELKQEMVSGSVIAKK